MTPLKKVERATAKVVAALSHQRLAVIEAHEAGLSTREIARAADVSHTQVQRLIHTDQSSGS